jgi:hypothetical protein
MFRIAPKAFNPVNMVLALVGEGFAVVQSVVLSKPFERVVAPEGVSIVDRAFSRVLLDVDHKFVGRHLFNNFGIHLTISLKKAKNNAFSGRSTAPPAFPSASKIRLVQFYLTFQFATLKLGHMVDRFTQALIDAGHTLVMNIQVSRYPVGRLLLVEPGQNHNLPPQLFERFLFSTGFLSASDIPSTRLRHPERTAENTLSTPQKVGRTIENVLFVHNQALFYHVLGYESN